MNLKTILSAGALVAIGMVAGRLFGMVREMMLAAHFGIGQAGDMAITMMIIPDFITNALVASATSAALVPAFGARTPERAIALMWQSLAVSASFFALVTLFIALQGNTLLAPLTHESVEGASSALSIALLSIPISVATWVLTAYLQHRGKFLVPAFANVIFNGVIIATLWLGADRLQLLAYGIVVGAIVRFIPHFTAYWRAVEHPRPRFGTWELDRRLIKIYALSTGSGMFGLLPLYAPYAVVAAFGSSIASFNYAFKLVLLPCLLGQTVIQLVVLPWLVAQRKLHDAFSIRVVHTQVLQATWLIALAASLSLTLAAHPIATLFFSYGRMTAEDIATIGTLFTFGIWATPGMLLLSVWQVFFFAAEQPTPPLRANIAQAALVVPICWLGHEIGGIAGVLIGFALLQVLCTLILVRTGLRTGMIAAFIPDRTSFTVTLIIIAVWLPCAALFYTLESSAILGFVMAAFCGLILLGVGIATSPVARQQLKNWVHSRHENHSHHQ